MHVLRFCDYSGINYELCMIVYFVHCVHLSLNHKKLEVLRKTNFYKQNRKKVTLRDTKAISVDTKIS